jgi:hypothetical protein
MHKLTGVKLTAKSLDNYRHLADLIAFDGPLVSLMSNDAQEEFLLTWIDCSKNANRWLLLDVARANLRRYLLREVSLLEVFHEATSFVAYDNFRGVRKNIVRISLEDIPADYLPTADSYLTPDIASADAKKLAHSKTIRYSIGLDGEMPLIDLGTFTKLYQQLYSFHYGLEHLDREAVRQIIARNASAWTGGRNSVNMFSGLNAVMPSVHRARVTEMEFHSPGHIELELLPVMAKQIHAAVVSLTPSDTFARSAELYSEIYKFFKRHGLGFEDDAKQQDTPLPAAVATALTSYVDRLLQLFGWHDYRVQFLSLPMSPLAQLRALLAYYRRLRRLVRYQQRRMISIEAVRTNA